MIGLGQRPAVASATLASLTRQAPTPRSTRLLEHHLLMLVSAGQGSHEVDFVAYPCRPGTVLWARPGQVVRYGGGAGMDAVAVIWPAGFLPDLTAVPWPCADRFGPVCWQLTGEDEDAVIDEMSQLVVDCQRHGVRGLSGARGLPDGDGPGAELLRHELAVLVLRLAIVPPLDPYPVAGADTFLQFRQEVEAGYTRCRQVAEYAQRLGCSVRTLTRACLTATGRSAKQVIDDRVVLEAKRLLSATDLPVATVGERLGFAEQTHFCRLFHRAVGCPPGVYRSAAQEPGTFRGPAGVPAQRSALSAPAAQLSMVD